MESRAELLRSLIERVETGVGFPTAATIRLGLGRKDGPHLFWESVTQDSLNAVRRLEAPLRERGWWLPLVVPPGNGREWSVSAALNPPGAVTEGNEAPTEARARLLAALKAMLHEEETAP
jgi:hypothetical protein